MTEMFYTSLQEQYNILMEDIKSIEPCLRLLYHDQFLQIEQQYRFSFAVDFHEVWNYASPIAEFTQSKSEEKPLTQEDSLRKQVARAGLFYGLKPGNVSVLLPPYVIELNDKRAQMSAGLLDGMEKLEGEYIKKLNNIVNNETVRNAMAEFQNPDQIRSDTLQQLKPLFEKKLSDLLFLISGVTGQRRAIIQELLSGDSPKVQSTDSQWPDLKELIQLIMDQSNSKWHDRFKKTRPGSRYTLSNVNDAKAIDLVLALNQYLSQKKELVFIVSDTRAMEQILRERPTDADDNSTGSARNYAWTEADGVCVTGYKQDLIPIFRPIDTFYYSILFQSDSSESTLQNLKDELERIDRVYVLDKSFQELRVKCLKCNNERDKTLCSFSDACSDVHRELSEHHKHFAERKDALLAVNRFPVIKPYYERVKAQQSVYEQKLTQGSLALIQYLSEPRESLEKNFRDREKELLKMMESDLMDAFNLVAEVSPVYQEEIGGGIDKFTRTKYRIRFRNVKLDNLLQELEQARYEGKVAETVDAHKKLITLAFQESLGLDRSLLWAVLLLSCRFHDRTVRLTTRVLRDIGSDYRSEYFYLRALAYYESKDFSQTILECRTGFNKFVSDARFYHLCGLAISRQIDSNDSRGHSWSDAIDCAEKARTLVVKFSEDEKFQGVIANNLAYFHYRRNRPGDLETALDYVNELKHLIPSFENSPEFLNTIGCVFKGFALKAKDETIQQQYKKKALYNLEKALQLAKDTKVEPSEIGEYEDDLRDTEQQLITSESSGQK